MEIDIVTIVLLLLIVILVATIAFLIGKRSSSHSSHIKNKSVDRDRSSVGITRQAPLKYDNSAHISKISNALSQYSKTIAHSTIENIYTALLEPLSELEEWNANLDENNFTIDDLEKSLTIIKFRNIKSKLESNISKNIAPIINFTNESLDFMQSKFGDPELKKYKLSDEKMSSIDTKINTILKKILPKCLRKSRSWQ